MEKTMVRIAGLPVPIYRLRTVVIGSGCAGLNAADWLYDLGETDIALLTEGLRMGTSRNTGSDKQTYYKLSLAADQPDSAGELSQTLFVDGVHGDTAWIEAACSAQSFFKLVQLGVPFPTNALGEFVGYRTDHDPRQRATSAGPLTSKYMTECLEKQVLQKNIALLTPMVAFALLKETQGRICGVLAYQPREADQPHHGYVLLCCAHVVLATGGPAQIYATSVYPACHTGMTGMALAAGAMGANLHQWQYGLASTTFRWNVSGSYQQVLPRYLSIDAEGTVREFLNDYFEDPMEAIACTFLKGYQWPFDTAKVEGSSRLDLLVHQETCVKGRRVYLDFQQNPYGLDASLQGLPREAHDYLARSGALQATPIERLQAMNPSAIALYAAHGIDLFTQPLEIAVCAQHHNGGLAVDAHWQTTIPGLYAVGEAAGTFGAYRPGGSALNATQVGSMRAAQHIAYDSDAQPQAIEDFIAMVADEVEEALELCEHATISQRELMRRRKTAQQSMSRYAAHWRDPVQMQAFAATLPSRIDQAFTGNTNEIRASRTAMLKYRDMLVTQQAVLHAMQTAAAHCGSTGAGLVRGDAGMPVCKQLPKDRYLVPDVSAQYGILYTQKNAEGTFASHFAPTRPLPERDGWFESVWRTYRKRMQRGGKQKD